MAYKYEGLSDKIIIDRLKGLQEELTSIIDCMNGGCEEDISIVSNKDQTVVKQASLNNSVRQRIYDITDHNDKLIINTEDDLQQDISNMFPRTKAKSKRRKRTTLKYVVGENNNVQGSNKTIKYPSKHLRH